MKMKQFFNMKIHWNKVICRLLVAFVVAGMILPTIPGGVTEDVYAETTEPDPTVWATPLVNSTNGTTLDTGFYYVKPDTTVSCTNNQSGGNGITIKANATVYIYIPEGSTLNATGGAGSGQYIGGGAGIYLPSSSTLIFLGNGTVNATGGRAADGADGGEGGDAVHYSYGTDDEDDDTFTPGSGGYGGHGGAGAGAGIGTNGGSGGSGGSGGYAYNVSLHKQNTGQSGNAVTSPGAGSSAAEMGNVYRASTVKVNAVGGRAGNGGDGGDSGDTTGGIELGDPYRGASGGAGGGGGGGGYAGANVGTGGHGGAGGGGGAGAGYQWCGYYVGGGSGGGGAGGNGGKAGNCGSNAKIGDWGGNSTRTSEVKSYATLGGNGSYSDGGNGGNSSKVYCRANDGTETYGYSGAGGAGASYYGTKYSEKGISVITTDLSKYYQYPVYFDGADENSKQYYYTGRSENTVIAPSYTVEENQYFIGWRVTQTGYAFSFNDSAVDEGAFLRYDEIFYQEGDEIKIASDTYGPVVLEPIVASSAGNKAVSEVLTIEPDVFENATTYLTYQVETLVNGVREDVGQITLVKAVQEDNGQTEPDNDEERYLVSSGSGENRGLYKYTIPSAVPIEEAPVFSVHAKGEDTGVSASAGDVVQISYKEMQVITRVDGEPSDWPGMITLADEDAPVLAKQGMGTYSFVDLEKNVDEEREYTIVIDGVESDHTVSFGETVYINYSSVQVYTEGNVKVGDVVLQNEEAHVSLPLEYRNGAWGAIQQNNALSKDELAYTIYINGVKTDFDTVLFDSNSNALELGVYKTRFITRKDNVVTDDMVDDIYLGTHLTQRADVGTYETIHVINPAVDSDTLTYYVNSVYGEEEASTALGEDVILDYYTIRYNGGSEYAENIPVDNTAYRKGTEIKLAYAGDMSSSGKSFVGWSVDDTDYAAGDVLVINDTMYPVAQWETTIYTITYDMNDSGEDGAEAEAVNPNASLVSYTVDDVITLINPTRQDCTFMGWTYEETMNNTSGENVDEVYPEMNPVKDLTIPAGHTGDITFVAHWAVHQYNIDVDIAEYDFGTRIEGYADSTLPEAVTITITNVGNMPVTLSSVTSIPVDETITQSAFLCSSLSKTSLAVGESATFTIRPMTGVASGEHEEVVTVTTTKGTEANVNVKFLVGKDTTPPEMTVNVGTDSWAEFEESISLTDMKKYGQATTVSINVTDAESPMGRVQYYLAKEPMAQAQLEALSDAEWQTYTAEFTITDNKQFILYARSYDTADPANVKWVSTDVLEIDTIAPVIIGVQAGTYYGETTFVVEDANAVTVTLDGTELTPDANGKYTLPVEKGVKKNLVATDIHGHATTMEVTVNNIKYDISYDANGGVGTMATDSIESGENVVLSAAKFTAPNSQMEFAYWTIRGDQSNTMYTAGSNYTVTGDVTFVANWTYKEYSIVFDLQGGEFAEGVVIPSSYTGVDANFTIPTPSRLGYDFAGWTWEGQTTPATYVTIETGSNVNYKFTANWTESTVAKYVVRHWLMKVTADAGVNEYELKEETEFSGEHAAIVTPEVDTYPGFTSPATVTLTLDSKQKPVVDYYYTRNTYQMDMVVNNVIVKSVTGLYGSEQSMVVTDAAGYGPLSLVGIYDFAGNQLADTSEIVPVIKSLDGVYNVTAVMPAQNVRIVFGRTPIEYNITYDLDGGEVKIGSNPTTYTVATEAFYLTAPEKIGYAFRGWTWDEQTTPVKEVMVNTSAVADLNFKANWELLDASVSQGDYLVSHYQQNLDGTTYTLVESERCYGVLNRVVIPMCKDYPGFITPTEKTVTISAENTDNVDYYYNRESYTLTWNCGEGVSEISTNPQILDIDPETDGIQVYYGTPIEATAVLVDGYLSAEFTGFGENATNKKSFIMPEGDVSITVTGTPRTYSITYQLTGGSFKETAKGTYNITEQDYAVPVPVKAGYTFAGWTVIVNGVSTDGTTGYTVDTAMCADIILNARWVANEAAYTVKHCKENPDGTGYTEVLADRECGTAAVGTILTPAVKNYNGYVSPATISVTVLADGSTEVVYKYDFIEYVVDDDEQNADNLEDIQDRIEEITDVMEEIENSYPDIDNQIAENNAEITEKNAQIAEKNTRIESINNQIATIDERLSDESLSEDQKAALNTEKAGLVSEKEELETENGVLESEIATLESENETLENQKQEGLNANEEYQYFKEKKEALEALQESIAQTQEDLSAIDNQFENSEMNPALGEVTSEDKQNLQDLVDSIDELLEAEPNYLSEEEKDALLNKRTELAEKLQQIEEVKESILEVEDRMQYLPSLEEVSSNDETTLQDLAENIEEVLQSTNLTQAERDKLIAEKETIQDKLDRIAEVKSEFSDLQTRDNAVNKETVTADDKDTLETLIQDLQQMLDDNENNMTEAEKQDIKNRISQLQDELCNLEQIQEDLAGIEEKYDNAPGMDDITTDDRYAIENLVDEINTLLSNNSEHMTDAEKNALNEKREELLEKLEEIERIQNAIDDVFNKDAEVDIMNNVSSDDLELIKETQKAINELLQNESDHLTDDQKQALQDTLSDLSAKKAIIEEYAEVISAAKEFADGQAPIGYVKEADRPAIEEAKQKLQDLLGNSHNANHLSDTEKEELAQRMQDLQEKLEHLDAAEDAKEAMDNAYEGAMLPGVDQVKTDDLETVSELYEQVQDVLENYGNNMSLEELAEYEEISNILQEMRENITKVKEVIELVQENYPNIPVDEELTSNNIEIIDEMVTEINDVLDNYGGNLTEEQKADLESKLTVLENKKNILQNTADKLDNIDQIVGSLPELDDVTSENKEAIEELISDIEETLAMEPSLLSEEDKEALNTLKQELQNAIDKLNEVAGDLSDIQDSVANIPSADEVKTSDRTGIEQLVEDIEQMLAEDGSHLSEEEKDELLQLKEELQEKLDSIEALEQEMDKIVNSATEIPEEDELKIGDENKVQDVITLIDEFISDYGTKLSEEELKKLADEKIVLEEKLRYIEGLIEEEKDDTLEPEVKPEPEVQPEPETKAEMEAINNAFNAVNELENLEEVSVQSLEQLVERIEQFITDKGTDLSQDELENLTSIKSRLQEMIDTVYTKDQNAGTNTGTGQNEEQVPDEGTQGDEDVPLGDDTSEEEGDKEDTGKDGYTVEIYSGQKLVERITGLTEGEVLDLAAIKDGIYTIVTTDGERVDTRMLVVKDGESNIAAVKGVDNKETEVQFIKEEYRMAVEGLEQIFAIPELHEKVNETVESGGSCTIRFVVQEPEKTPGMAEMESRAKEEDHKIARVFDFTVAAHIYAPDGKETVIPISDTEYLLLTAIPLEEFEKGKAKYYVYRSHEWEQGKGEVVEMLPELFGEEKQKPTMEGFYVDGDYVYIWASKYSLYALAYDDVTVVESDDIIDEEQASKNCWLWWLLLLVIVVLVGVKKYHDYKKSSTMKSSDK